MFHNPLYISPFKSVRRDEMFRIFFFCPFQEGTYAELMANEGEFADFVVTYTAKQLEQEKSLRILKYFSFFSF